MKKIYYSDLDKYIEDTKSWRQLLAIELPKHTTVIIHRHVYPDLAIWQDSILKSVRLWFFEATYVKGGQSHKMSHLFKANNRN